MATLLGTYTASVYNVLGSTQGYTFSVRVEYEQSIANNTTTLYITPTLGSGSNIGYAVTVNFAVDGNIYHNIYHNFGTWGSTLTGNTYTKTVSHNNDGTLSMTLSVSMSTTYEQGANNNLNTGVPKKASVSKQITLPTIPRASSFSFSGDFTMGATKDITINRASDNFTHTLTYRFGSVSGTIGTGLSVLTRWTPSRDLGKQIPNSASGVGTLTLQTYNGGTLIGTSSKTFTLWVAGDMYPSFSSLQLTGNNLSKGSYVQTLSSVTATIIGETTSYGSPIVSRTITGHMLNVSAVTGTSDVFTGSGNAMYTATIKDARGRSATKTASIYIEPYRRPTIELNELFRSDNAGNPQNEGMYVTLKFSYSFADFSTNLSKGYEVSYNSKSQYSWSAVATEQISNISGDITSVVVKSEGFDIRESFGIHLNVYDEISSTSAEGKISVASCVMNIEKEGVGIGKYHSQGTLDVGGEMYIDGSLKMTDLNSTANFGMGITLRHELQHQYDTTIECTEDYPFYVWTANAAEPSELSITDNGALQFNGYTVPYTKTINFTPYLFSNSATSAIWTQTKAVGMATYLGDLIFVQGMVTAVHDGSPNGNAEVAIGGLPELNIWNYPPVNFSFIQGLNTNLNSQTYATRGYVEAGTSYIRLCFDYRQIAGWQYLKSTHIQNGEIQVCFSVLYRWQ